MPREISFENSQFQTPTYYPLVDVARQIVSAIPGNYAASVAPHSFHPLISGNKIPGQSNLEWLRNRSKCNQFVGDVLTLSGYSMPTYRMADGSLHYANAEALPGFRQHFQQIIDPRQVRAGDLLILDWPKTGENGAHVEIISWYSPGAPNFLALGAHSSGAKESTFPNYFNLGTFDPERTAYRVPSAKGDFYVKVLRPKL